jgi:hypothetical protein
MNLLFAISMIIIHNFKMKNPSSTLVDLKNDYLLLNRFYQFVGIYLIVTGAIGILDNAANGNNKMFFFLGLVVVGSILVGLHYSYNNEEFTDYEKLKEYYVKLNNMYLIVGSISVALMILFPLVEGTMMYSTLLKSEKMMSDNTNNFMRNRYKMLNK